MKEHFIQLFDYDRWANQILVERFEKQFPVNPRIYQLFSHMLSAQRVWLDRCVGIPQSVQIWSERLPDEMKEDAENYNLAWIAFIDQLHVHDFERLVNYTNSRGETFDNQLTDIIAHVINHGTHHRGGIMILMKEEGFALPNIDFISFVRQR